MCRVRLPVPCDVHICAMLQTLTDCHENPGKIPKTCCCRGFLMCQYIYNYIYIFINIYIYISLGCIVSSKHQKTAAAPSQGGGSRTHTHTKKKKKLRDDSCMISHANIKGQYITNVCLVQKLPAICSVSWSIRVLGPWAFLCQHYLLTCKQSQCFPHGVTIYSTISQNWGTNMPTELVIRKNHVGDQNHPSW